MREAGRYWVQNSENTAVLFLLFKKRIIELDLLGLVTMLHTICHNSPTTGIIRMFEMEFPARTRWGYSCAVLRFVEINNIAKASEII